MSELLSSRQVASLDWPKGCGMPNSRIPGCCGLQVRAVVCGQAFHAIGCDADVIEATAVPLAEASQLKLGSLVSSAHSKVSNELIAWIQTRDPQRPGDEHPRLDVSHPPSTRME